MGLDRNCLRKSLCTLLSLMLDSYYTLHHMMLMIPINNSTALHVRPNIGCTTRIQEQKISQFHMVYSELYHFQQSSCQMHTEGTLFLQMHNILGHRNCKNWQMALNIFQRHKECKWRSQQPNMCPRDKDSIYEQKSMDYMFQKDTIIM